MKPINFRLATFEELKSRLAGGRAAVFAAWQRHGPGPTAEVAAKAGISILSFRPRTTELCYLGFVGLTRDQPAKGKGVYRAGTDDEIRNGLEERREHVTRQCQLEMTFGSWIFPKTPAQRLVAKVHNKGLMG